MGTKIGVSPKHRASKSGLSERSLLTFFFPSTLLWSEWISSLSAVFAAAHNQRIFSPQTAATVDKSSQIPSVGRKDTNPPALHQPACFRTQKPFKRLLKFLLLITAISIPMFAIFARRAEILTDLSLCVCRLCALLAN